MRRLANAALAALLSIVWAALAQAGGRTPTSNIVVGAFGAVVEEVVSGSAADQAGIRAGDRIVAINGEAIGSDAELDAKLSASDGRRLTIDIDRGGARLRVRTSTRAMAPPDRFSVLNSPKVLGIAHWALKFAPSDDPGETYIPPPPIPTPPPDPAIFAPPPPNPP